MNPFQKQPHRQPPLTGRSNNGKAREVIIASPFVNPFPGSTATYREIENAVIGAMLLEKEALQTVLEIIPEAACFFHEGNRVTYAAIQALAAGGGHVDLLTVTEALGRAGDLETAGGAHALTQRTMAVVSTAHVEAHSRILVEQWMKRRIAELSAELQAGAFEEATDSFDLLDNAEKALTEIAGGIVKTPFRPVSLASTQLLQNIREARETGREVVGITSGLPTLDAVTGGFQQGNLIIFAARPGMGKTAFGLNIATRCSTTPRASGGGPVAFFSLEMSEEELMQRILAERASVELDFVRKPHRLSPEGLHKLEQTVAALQSAPLFLDETAGLSVPEFRSKARRLKHKYDIQMIIIDYLQLMSGDMKRNGNREQEVAQITRELKKTGKELGIPIIAFSQLNRGIESRADKKPMLSDLRESGAIEQDADMVGFLYRPTVEEVKQDARRFGTACITIEKYRHGAPAQELVFRFEGPFQRWAELDSTPVQWQTNHIPSTNHNFSAGTQGRSTYPAAIPQEDLPF